MPLTDIVLKERDGTETRYQNDGVISVPLADGSRQTFVAGEYQEKTVDLDFSNGDMTVTPDAGKVFTKVEIPKPDTLIPGNIAKGVNIAGITGTVGGGLALSPWPFDEPNDDATRIYFYGNRFVLNQIGTAQKTIDWGDGATYTGTGASLSHSYESTDFYCVTINGSITFKTSTTYSGPYWYCLQTNQYSMYDLYLRDQIQYMSLGKYATLSGYGLCQMKLRGLRLRGKSWSILSGALYSLGYNQSTPVFIDALDSPSLSISIASSNSSDYPYISAIYAKKLDYISLTQSPSIRRIIVVDDPVINVDYYGLYNSDILCASGDNTVTIIPKSSNCRFGSCSIAGEIIIRDMTTMPSCSYTKYDKVIIESRITKINRFGSNCQGGFPEIPDTVTSIGDNFMYYAIGITNVTIPDNCTSVGGYFCYSSTINSLTIGKGLTKIPNNFCSYCHSLKAVTIPENITSIGSAFQTCINLKEVHIQAKEPPALPAGTSSSSCPFVKSGSGAMSQSYSFSTTIYVPKGCADAYKAAAGWSNMASKIVEEPDS